MLAKRQIEFELHHNGGEAYTRSVVITEAEDNFPAYVTSPATTCNTRADIDALIAALREARDALPGPGGARGEE